MDLAWPMKRQLMGWILRKSKARPKRPGGSTNSQAWDMQRTLARLKLVGLVCLGIVLLVSWSWLERSLLRHVGTHRLQHITADRVVFESIPRWMSPIVQRELTQVVVDQLSKDPLDRGNLHKAMAALVANPWVETVHHVERSAERVSVVAEYREPIAVVAGRDGYHLADAGGVRLPGLYVRDQIPRLGLPLIVGVAAAPRESGDVWPGEDLQAGLRLIRLLHGELYMHQIQEFDVSGRDSLGRIHLVLRTREGMVRWGLAPGREQGVEPDALTKKRWLGSVHRQRGTIDAGGKVVVLYGAAVYVHQRNY